MKKAHTYAEAVKYDTKKKFNKLIQKPDDLELIGKGRSAYVFKLTEEGGREMALKVFFPEFKNIAAREAEIYKKLSDSNYYPDIYETGPSYILMEYIKGYTFYECLNKGIRIDDDMICEVDRALNDARRKGTGGCKMASLSGPFAIRCSISPVCNKPLITISSSSCGRASKCSAGTSASLSSILK